MSSSIVAAPDSRSAVRYTRKVEEKRGDGEEDEAETLEEEEHHVDLGSQKARPHTPKNPAAAKRRCSKATTATLGLIYLLILAGIYIRYVLVTLEKEQLQVRYDKLQKNFSDVLVTLEKEQLQVRYDKLQKTFSDMAANNSQLLSSYQTLSENHTQLQDEVKKLKIQTKEKCCPDGWKRFGCSCYFKSNQKKSFYESRNDCLNKGAHLVIINNKEEQKFVGELSVDEESWIGLWPMWTGQTIEWRWVDESPLTELFWAPGQKHTAHYWKAAACCDQEGRWIQRENDVTKKWICEKKVS